MKWNIRTRCTSVCVAFIALFSIFSFRLVYLQIVKHDEYAEKAAKQNGGRQPIYAERGRIVDANGEILAQNVPSQLVYADAPFVNNREAAVVLLSEALNIPASVLAEKLTSKRHYVVLKREVPENVVVALRDKLQKRKVKGIGFVHDATRVYPNHTMLCHVIGFTNFDHEGIQGVEGSMEETLHGQDGYRDIERNSKGEEIALYRGQEREAQNGSQVQLTIDLNLQNIVENEIDDAVSVYRPATATIILMRPQTGEILAMANRPNFDLNLRAAAKEEQKKNRAITDQMEPGSTFKIVAAAAALNEHKVRPDTIIFCENGVWNFGGIPLHDHRPLGDLSVRDILVKSSNIGAAKLALRVGEQKYYEYIRRFGFYSRTDVELLGEILGTLRPQQKWNKVDITHIPMGQGIAVTPLQMTMAMATIANGGKLMKPHIVKSITDADGHISPVAPTVLRQVISPETAAQIGDALRGVVSEQGTAKKAVVPGFTICGKTGTAQIPRKGGYEKGKYIVSFLGYLPAENPQFVGLVVLNDAHTDKPEDNYGGVIAGPIFSHVAAKAARYLDLEPHEDVGKDMTTERVALTNAPRR